MDRFRRESRTSLVSILVVLDQPLGHPLHLLPFLLLLVSILVVLDQPLGRQNPELTIQFLGGFNPCCSGSASRTLLDSIHTYRYLVSILVVLDQPLGPRFGWRQIVYFHVSILVVLDQPLGQHLQMVCNPAETVSILVVLDQPLGPI